MILIPIHPARDCILGVLLGAIAACLISYGLSHHDVALLLVGLAAMLIALAIVGVSLRWIMRGIRAFFR